MALPGQLRASFQCSICLDRFSNPVSTPCGHNFCKVCIDAHWDNSVRFQCPLCQESFELRPQLCVNTMLRDLLQTFSQMTAGNTEGSTKHQEVLCNVCTRGKKVKAIQSCSGEHLQAHLIDAELEGHMLLDPVSKLKERVCRQHKKPLEMVCKTDLTRVSVPCVESDHRNHECVSLEGRLRQKKIKFDQALEGVHQLIKECKDMVNKVQQSMEISKENVSADIQDTERAFHRLHQVTEVIQSKVIATIDVHRRNTENRGHAIMEELQEELNDLERRRHELEQLSSTEDHLPLLKPPATKDWSEISAFSDACVGTVRSALHQLRLALHNIVDEEIKKLEEKELRRIQQYAVDVTLDCDTANPALVVSADRKRVTHDGVMRQNVPDNPERFDTLLCVLGKEGYSSGAFYFEVQVENKSRWDIGVALQTVKRKGSHIVHPSQGYCVLMLRDNTFLACDRTQVAIELSKEPQKVGVFVDYDVGEVAFYDVGNKSHIYSFTRMKYPKNLFPVKLHPYLNPCTIHNGDNSAPMVITTPVSSSMR